MSTKCLVNENGFITTDQPLFLCKWNGCEVAIHTRLTLYANYKDTNLYDANDGWSNFENINQLLDHLSFQEQDGYFDSEIYINDNMSIQRIY